MVTLLIVFLCQNVLAAQTYVVKQGDCLSGIAENFQVKIRELYAANRKVVGSNPNLIFPGQELIIPLQNKKTDKSVVGSVVADNISKDVARVEKKSIFELEQVGASFNSFELVARAHPIMLDTALEDRLTNSNFQNKRRINNVEKYKEYAELRQKKTAIALTMLFSSVSILSAWIFWYNFIEKPKKRRYGYG